MAGCVTSCPILQNTSVLLFLSHSTPLAPDDRGRPVLLFLLLPPWQQKVEMAAEPFYSSTLSPPIPYRGERGTEQHHLSSCWVKWGEGRSGCALTFSFFRQVVGGRKGMAELATCHLEPEGLGGGRRAAHLCFHL